MPENLKISELRHRVIRDLGDAFAVVAQRRTTKRGTAIQKFIAGIIENMNAVSAGDDVWTHVPMLLRFVCGCNTDAMSRAARLFGFIGALLVCRQIIHTLRKVTTLSGMAAMGHEQTFCRSLNSVRL